MADLAETPSVIASQREQVQLLHEALRRIPIDSQIVLELYYWEELPASGIGAVLEIPVGTVRSRIRRAKAQLQDALASIAPKPALADETMADLERWAVSLRDRVGQ